MRFIPNFLVATPLRVVALFFVILLALVCLPRYLFTHHTGGTLTAVVENKERVCESSGGECRWMVMTDKVAFVNTDTLWHLKYDSTDLQGQVHIGEKQTFTYYGWRIPFLSLYPNIISVE